MKENFPNLFITLSHTFWGAVVVAFRTVGVEKQFLCSVIC